MAAAAVICPPSGEDGLTLQGNTQPSSNPSAVAIVAAIGVGSEPLAMFSFAAINCLARMMLASPLTELLRILSNCT